MDQIHYFRSDLGRLIKNYPIYLAVLGVAATLWFSLENNAFQEGMINGNVLDTYIVSTNMSGIMIAYSFCAFSYAAVFCEDLENKYARYSIIRGNTWRYAVSKSTVIYGASVITMVLGTLLFVACIRLRLPWISENADMEYYRRECTVYSLMGSITGFMFFYMHCSWECLQACCRWLLLFYLCMFLIK